MTKDAILVPTGEIHKLADALFTLVSYQLKVDRESKAEVFFADGQVAISIHDLSRQIKEHFVSAKIEESEIVLDESGSIPIQESRSGLNLFQLLMLAAAPLSNSSDETLRREVLIVFEHLETLVRTLNRLIRFDCHDRVSWVKSRHNETNCFYLRVIDMPLFELLRLQDENDLGDPAEPTVALYRKLFAGGRPTTVYIPWGYSYPALEKVLSKLPPLDSTFLIDPGDFVTMPDESRYTRLYDDESRLTAVIDTQEAVVSTCPEWPEFTVPIELRKKRPFDKETHDKSALWLLDANQLEALEKKLAHTSESDLLSLDAAVFSSNDQVRLAVRCRTNIDRHKAFFTGMTECYREWLSGQGTSILFLPSGYELYPSLRRETYLKALGIAGLVDDTAVFIPNAQGPPTLLHFPNSMFQSMRRTLVDYRITVNKQEIEKIIDASILDYDDFEIIAGDTQKENNLRDPETRRGRKKAAKQEAVSTSADGTAGRSSPKNSGPVQPKVIGYQEMKSIVRKARDIRYRNYTIPFDEMLSKREWQKLNQATGVHSAKTMDLIPSGLSNLLRENYLGIPQLLLQHRSHKQKQTTIEKLNAIFTDALGILPNSNTLKTSLVKLFGPTGIKITRSSITIQPPPSEDGKDSLGILPDPAKNKGAKNSQTDDIGDLEKEIERALLLSVVPKLKRTKTTTSIDDLLAQKMPLHRKLLVVVHGLFHKPWQEMIEKIVGEYQQIPWNLWNGIFFVHKSQNILAKNEEDALAIKIIFEADPTKAGQFLRKYIDDETVFEPEELPVFISAASHPLPRRVLTLFAAAFHRSFPATDRLAETVTSLDEEVAHSDDLRLQWLYSTACFKFTEDVGINTRILGRIFRRIREGQVGNLVLPFIASAVAERNGTAQQTLQEQSKNLFQEYDPILLIWMKLLEAWYNLKTNPSLLGQPPACEPGLENCAVCSPKLPGRGGFFCSMRKRFDAVDTRTEGGLGSVLNLFKAFLQLIERATGDATLKILLDIENGPSNQDVPGIEPLKTFLLSLEERQEAGSGRSVGKTAPLNLNWFASPQECVRLMDALLTEQVPSEEFRNMAARVSESPQETKLLLDTIELPDMLVRLTRLLGMVPEWQKMGQQASIDMVMEITSNFKMDVTDTIDLKKTRFIMARIEALVAAGRIEEAVSQAKIPLNKVMSIPFESRCRQIVELCRIFQGMSSLEKVTHRNAIDDLFQDAQFFKSSKIDFSICSQYKLELLWAITEIFKSNSSNEDDAINRVVNIERNQLLRRIR